MADLITIPSETVQEVLDALEYAAHGEWASQPIYGDAITALRTALEAPDDDDLTIAYMAGYHKGKQAAPVAQKVEKCIDCGDEVPKGACYCKEGCAHAIGYAAQQAAPAAQKVEHDCTPNHYCDPLAKMIHLPTGEQCDRCGGGA